MSEQGRVVLSSEHIVHVNDIAVSPHRNQERRFLPALAYLCGIQGVEVLVCLCRERALLCFRDRRSESTQSVRPRLYA